MPGKYTIIQCNNLITWNVLVTQVYGDPMPLKYSAILFILGSWLHDSLYTKALSNSLYIRSVAKKPSFLLDLILAARKPAICIFWMYHILQPTHPPRSLSQDKMMLGYSHLSGILSGNLPSSTNSLLRFPQSPVCFKTLSLSYFFNPGNNIRWCQDIFTLICQKTFDRRISKLGANISGETTFVSHILVAQESEVFMATISLNIIPTQTLDGPISPENSLTSYGFTSPLSV